jgi:NADH-quinone oxidoreductase subunit N
MSVPLLAQAAPPTSSLLHVNVEYSHLLPEVILVGGALAMLVLSSMIRRRARPGLWGWCSAAISAAALGSSIWVWHDVDQHGPSLAVRGALAVDGFSVFIMVTITSALVLLSLLADRYLVREGLDGVELYVLALLCGSGGILMGAANDLLVLFLGLEILSISLYVLAGFHRRRAESGEAAMKYLILGGFSSAIFLYGVALTYGATGSTNLQEIADFLARDVIVHNGILLAGLTFLLVGLGFKVAAVPFHTWTPDVYQGSPTPVTGFMAAAAKAAGFAGLIRVLSITFSTERVSWQPVIWILAVLTLTVGAVLAVVQQDIKRMLAYSSINHAGFVLIGLQAASPDGVAGSLFYLLAYTFMIMGSFAVVTIVAGKGDAAHSLERYRGLSSRRPGLALIFTVLLMAQTGVPFTTGFLAKFYVISAGVKSHSYALAVIGMLAAAVAAFFYLRVIVLMYSPIAGSAEAEAEAAEAAEAAEEAAPAGGGVATVTATATETQTETERITIPFTAGLVLFITLGFTIVFGIYPSPIIDFARSATLLH